MNITLNINIESINISAQPQESVQETPVATLKRGHRTLEDVRAMQLAARLAATEVKQAALQKRVERLQRKFSIAEKIRKMLGDEAANRFLAGAM